MKLPYGPKSIAECLDATETTRITRFSKRSCSMPRRISNVLGGIMYDRGRKYSDSELANKPQSLIQTQTSPSAALLEIRKLIGLSLATAVSFMDLYTEVIGRHKFVYYTVTRVCRIQRIVLFLEQFLEGGLIFFS